MTVSIAPSVGKTVSINSKAEPVFLWALIIHQLFEIDEHLHSFIVGSDTEISRDWCSALIMT